MISRERVLRAINFKGVDRVPIMHGTIPAAFLKYGKDLVGLYQKYPSDFEPPPKKAPGLEELEGIYRKGTFCDEWGCVWRTLEDGILGEYIAPPLEDWNKLESYKFPDLTPDEEKTRQDKEVVKKNKENYFVIVGAYGLNFVFEKMQSLRGVENLMVDFIKQPDEVSILLDKLFDYALEKTRLTLELEPDGIMFGDDWGTQQNLLISPELWRKFFKPGYKKLFDLVHNKGAISYFHSDGQIMEIIPDFIEIGLDVLNPQFSCMDLEELARVTKNNLCISSDIDRQHILPFGKPEEVKEYVERVLEIFDAKNGGFIARGEINRDVPLENVEAMFQAFLEYE